MKILILAPGEAPHTIKWINGIAEANVEVILYSFTEYDNSPYKNNNNVTCYSYNLNTSIGLSKMFYAKLKYFGAIPEIKRIIRKHNPDILHAHYVSSYGVVASLINFKPFLISVWGSDIFDVPRTNYFNKKAIQFALNRAKLIYSTSFIMEKETKLYTKTPVQVIPFGIDPELFKPQSNQNTAPDQVVIGTVKALREKYGISYLIRAFKILVDECLDINLKLKIAGRGPEKDKYIQMVKDFELDDKVEFLGYIDSQEVPKVLSSFDIYVALSTLESESFGVAVIEASACELPAVVSNIGGLPEVVVDGTTGLHVTPKSAREAASAIKSLIYDKKTRMSMGKAGREFVINNYSFEDNLNSLISSYKNINNE